MSNGRCSVSLTLDQLVRLWRLAVVGLVMAGSQSDWGRTGTVRRAIDEVHIGIWRNLVNCCIEPSGAAPAESFSVYRPPDTSGHVLGRPLSTLKIALHV